MTIHLRALAAFQRDVCAACRPAALDDTTAVMDATAEPAPTFDDFGYRTGRAATPADLAYHELLSEVILDAANEAWHECGGVLAESWLLLDAPEGIDR